METAVDPFVWWRAAIAGKPGPIHADKPECGFFKMRDGKDGPWQPVAIWIADGKMICRVGSKVRDAQAVWTYCAKNPIPKEAAKIAFDTGSFPGDAPETPAIGDNSGDLSLAEQIKEYAAMALSWLRKTGVKDGTSKDVAANYRAKLLEFRKQADAEREIEKRPHLEASRAVDAKFKPLIEEADAAANELRDALTVYMREEERKEREAREKAWREEQERIAAERKRIEDERSKQMADDPIAALTSEEPELPMAPPPPEPVKVQAGGQRGRKTGLRTVTKYAVTDYEAALAHCKDHPTVREAVEKVCCAQAKAGAAVPGVSKTEEKVAA
ncbi:MAG: hypothetical protein C4523_10580 [Myxococcales bacterium]|nr:MAG: hypothetical protein C4523_10580 [Myxococcales bacterium]